MEVLKISIIIITIAIISFASFYLAFDLFRLSIRKKHEEEKIEKKRREDKLAGKK